MKNTCSALMGLFTLMACSEDVFQKAETQNGETGLQNQTNSFNDDNSGEHLPDGTKYPGDNYASPWDIWFNRGFTDRQPAYLMTNGTVENTSPFRLEVWAYAGLAYFDGANDGTYNDPKTGAQFPINNGNYPVLFANGQEVGNLVRTATPFILNPQEGFRMEDRDYHLPMPGGNNKSPVWPQVLNFGGQVTGAEETALREYGKVFFYEVDVYRASNNAFVGKYILHPQIATLGTTTAWKTVNDPAGAPLSGFVQPLGASFGLYYYDIGSISGTFWNENNPASGVNICDSREVVFRVPQPLHSHNILGKTLSLYITQNAYTFWQNSSLDLAVY